MLSYKRLLFLTTVILICAYLSYYLATHYNLLTSDASTNNPTILYKDKVFQINYPTDYNIKKVVGESGYSFFIYKGEAAKSDAEVCSKTSLVININTDGVCESLAHKAATSNIVVNSANILGQKVNKYDDFVKKNSESVEIRYDPIKLNGRSVQITEFINPSDYKDIKNIKEKLNQILVTLRSS